MGGLAACPCGETEEDKDNETIKILKQESESKNSNRKRRLSADGGGSISYDSVQLKDASIVSSSLCNELSSAKVSDLKFPDNVIFLKCNTNSSEAVEILLKNKIRAAPVIDNDNKYIGVLDLRDTLQYCLDQYKNESDSKSNGGDDIITVFTLRKFYTVNNNDNLLTVANILVNGAHIVSVVDVDDNNKLIGVITQRELFQSCCNLWVDTIVTNNCSLQNLLKIKIITSPIKSIKYNVSAFDAFQEMSNSNLSGLAVIDDNGQIIHNTSATDIKLWLLSKDNDTSDTSIKLEEPIEEFLINIRQHDVNKKDKYPITHCTLQQTLGRALSKLQATKYHRLWIIDQHKKPIGVLSLTDIFQFICKGHNDQP